MFVSFITCLVNLKLERSLKNFVNIINNNIHKKSMVFLRTDDIKDVLKNHLIKQKIEFKTGVCVDGKILDFLIRVGGKWCGVIVKGENSNIFTTFGQLVSQNRAISHLYLCAPEKFIERFKEEYSGSQTFKELEKSLGFIPIDDQVIKSIEQPSTKEYYFKIYESTLKNNSVTKQKKNNIELDEIDKNILKHLKERGITTVWDIIKDQKFDLKYKNPYETINKRIKNLTNFGYIKIVNKHPKIISLVRK